ncbi:MAG: hypothetical protein M1823_004669 [Watsoniomyces obsoletus]|nr:MAG: hypothetical protein M1823_004669 [Watsoniomyces obsoletus]
MSLHAVAHELHTVANLPRPLNADSDRYHISSVWGWDEGLSRKRKRAELGVGIDGEGVNIYNVEQSRLATSYALPPHTSFTCPPCSIRRQHTANSTIHRMTYASTKGPESRIYGFLDSTKRQARSGGTPETSRSVFSCNFQDVHRDVVHVDLLPSRNSIDDHTDLSVLLVHGDGELRYLAKDLKKEFWRCSSRTSLGYQKNGLSWVDSQIEYAMTSDVATGREGLLRGRGDALALLNAQKDVTTHSSKRMMLLILLSRPTSQALLQTAGRTLHVLGINSDQTSMTTSVVQSLCDFQLTQMTHDSAILGKISVDVSSGALQFLSDGVLFTYDLTETLPKLTSELHGKDGKLVSFVRLSPTHTVTATKSSLASYDLHYQSLQFRTPLALPSPSTSTQKRKKANGADEQQQRDAIDLLTFVSRSGLIVGRMGGQLVGLNVGSADIPSRKRARDGTLLDALGRGMTTGEAQRDSIPAEQSYSLLGEHFPLLAIPDEHTWQKNKKRMEKCAKHQDIAGFETAFAKAIGIPRDEAKLREWRRRKEAWEKTGGQQYQVNGNHPVNGVHKKKPKDHGTFPEPEPAPTWNWSSPEKDIQTENSFPELDRQQAIFVLAKIFRRRPPSDVNPSAGDRSLKIVFHPPNVLRWLLLSGNITLNSIESALQHQGGVPHPISISFGDLVHSVLECDVDETMLLSLLQGPLLFHAEDLLQAAQPIIQQLLQLNILDRRTLLMHNSIEAPHPTTMHDAGHDIPAARRDLLEKALTTVLIRLHTFPSSRVSHAFRTVLTMAELVCIIQFLRRDLAAAGWTSWHFEVAPVTVDGALVGIHDVCIISDLLSQALDSIGAVGWIRGPSIDDPMLDPDHFIMSLKMEISATLEVVEEATYMQGLVHEMLHYGKSGSTTSKNISAPKSVTDIMVIHPNPSKTPMLPLGSKSESDVPRTKTGKSGKTQRRTDRDMARMRNMRVGRYTVERIAI